VNTRNSEHNKKTAINMRIPVSMLLIKAATIKAVDKIARVVIKIFISLFLKKSIISIINSPISQGFPHLVRILYFIAYPPYSFYNSRIPRIVFYLCPQPLNIYCKSIVVYEVSRHVPNALKKLIAG